MGKRKHFVIIVESVLEDNLIYHSDSLCMHKTDTNRKEAHLGPSRRGGLFKVSMILVLLVPVKMSETWFSTCYNQLHNALSVLRNALGSVQCLGCVAQ